MLSRGSRADGTIGIRSPRARRSRSWSRNWCALRLSRSSRKHSSRMWYVPVLQLSYPQKSAFFAAAQRHMRPAHLSPTLCHRSRLTLPTDPPKVQKQLRPTPSRDHRARRETDHPREASPPSPRPPRRLPHRPRRHTSRIRKLRKGAPDLK